MGTRYYIFSTSGGPRPGEGRLIKCQWIWAAVMQELQTVITKFTILQKYKVMYRCRAVCFQLYSCFGSQFALQQFLLALDLGHLVSHVFFDIKMTVLDSLLINFATPTMYAQSFICL